MMRRICFAVLLALIAFSPRAFAYSVLSHEEVVDMAWKEQIIPLLQQRYPTITADELRQAHAYAYGGSVIQDIGYYPFGSHYFSDLLHYVRPNEFVEALIRDSKTPDEYAFALGALAHFCGDTEGHPLINELTSAEYPPLRARYGKSVTYAEDPTAHLRTEFGFDVVEVAQGNYSQQDYHDFIGFQVSKELLERAFFETYGRQMGDIIKHEDLAINTYRMAVSNLIPKFTSIAFVSYQNQVQKAQPGVEKSRFLYRLNKTEYRTEFGMQHLHVGMGGRIVAVLLHVVPKIGPFKSMKLKLPDAEEQILCLRSINSAEDKYKFYLGQIHAEPIPVPPPSAQDVTAAKDAAAKLQKDSKQIAKDAAKAKDTEDKARKEEAAAKVDETAGKAQGQAERTEAKAAAATPEEAQRAADAARAAAPPTVPGLPELDMDTGKPVGWGEYPLADETYAELLDELVKHGKAPKAGLQNSAVSTKEIDPALARDIEAFFRHPKPATGAPANKKQAQKQASRAAQVQANLVELRAMEQGAEKKMVAEVR